MATYETAQNQYVNVGGTRFAYRRLGRAYGVPLVLFMHFRLVSDSICDLLPSPSLPGLVSV